MNKDAIRLVFSVFAAAVTLAMSQEWFTWAFERHQWWRVIPGTSLAAAAVFEAHQVWRRAERILGM